MTAGHILLIEDDRDVRESLVDALEYEGYAVIGALDGLDALDKLRNDGAVPDLILLDLMMPRMTGSEFREELAKVPAWSGIPVIVITADGQGRSKAQALGANGFLKKPLKLADLFNIVHRILGEKR